MVTGQDFEEFTRLPEFDEIIRQQIKQLSTGYNLRLLGTSPNGDVFVSEEERELNFHILGSSGEGKSKFLEYNIRKDIDQGNGLCLLDPSDFGSTAKNVLAYCAKIGHKKVLYIDPATIRNFQTVPTIKPLNPKRIKQSVEGVMEVGSILFGLKDTDTPRIKRYMTAMLRLLTKEKLTLYESIWFSNYEHGYWKHLLGFDQDSLTLKNAFKSQYAWEQFFGSTINRLDSFWQEPLSLMLGSDTGIDFVEMVRDGWVILVNLFPGTDITPNESRLLGVLIISQIIQAVDVLRANKWKGIYYLYMDEAGRFATPQIDNVLSYKRKSGLRLVIAHHYFNQFEDRRVLDSIKQNAKVKMMFNTPSHDDRLEMMKALGYGKDIPPNIASYANQDLPKQYAIIKKGKEPPVRIRIPDVPDVNFDYTDYLNELLKNPIYKSVEQIKKEIDARKLSKNPQRTPPGKAHDRPATGSPPVSGSGAGKEIPKGDEKPEVPPKKRRIKI
jgi:hypothetical protein